MMNKPEAQTSDPIIKWLPDQDTLILELNRIQPKLHGRLTAKVKAKQEAYILGETARIFSPGSAKPDLGA